MGVGALVAITLIVSMTLIGVKRQRPRGTSNGGSSGEDTDATEAAASPRVSDLSSAGEDSAGEDNTTLSVELTQTSARGPVRKKMKVPLLSKQAQNRQANMTSYIPITHVAPTSDLKTAGARAKASGSGSGDTNGSSSMSHDGASTTLYDDPSSFNTFSLNENSLEFHDSFTLKDSDILHAAHKGFNNDDAASMTSFDAHSDVYSQISDDMMEALDGYALDDLSLVCEPAGGMRPQASPRPLPDQMSYAGSGGTGGTGDNIYEDRFVLPHGWFVEKDPNTGRMYYANLRTGETTWDRPSVAAPVPLQTPFSSSSSYSSSSSSSSSASSSSKKVKKTKKGNRQPRPTKSDDPRAAAAAKNSRSRARKWTKEEDEYIRQMVQVQDVCRWKEMGKSIHRTGAQCSQRWRKVLDPKVKRFVKWTPAEDVQLIKIHTDHPDWSNKQVAALMPERTPTQCHNRWWDKVNPVLRWEEWSQEEDRTLWEARKTGASWSKIIQLHACLRNRAHVAAKNRWHSLNLAKKKAAKKSLSHTCTTMT